MSIGQLMHPSAIEAVFFDAVGTLIHPQPPAPLAYAQIGRRFGSRYSTEEIARRFRSAFKREEELDRQHGWRTSEERERRRWRDIVADVLDDVNDSAACFAELYEHFASPQAWRVESAAATVLDELAAYGIALGLASNYDERLKRLLAALPALQRIQHVVISAAAGWRKPAPQFFAAVCTAVSLPAPRILFVGDDRENDYEGACAAGMRAVLLADGVQFADMRRILGEMRQ